MRNKLIKFTLPSFLLFLPILSRAEEAESLGDIAQNLVGISGDVHSFFQTVCIVAGISLIMGGFVKYRKHKKNPIAAPLSAAFVLIGLGVLLIGLAFIPPQVR